LPSFSGGHGRLAINIGAGSDAIVKMVRSGSSYASVVVYVRSNSTATVEGIPDGTYRVLFATGSGYEAVHKTFISGLSCAEFDEPLSYETTETAYPGWKITLTPVVGGNALTGYVPEDSFAGY
jgi:hypothetical protein